MMDVSCKPVLWIVLDDFVSYAEQQQPVRMTMGGHRRHGSLSDMLSSTATPSHHPRLDVATHGMQKLTITQPAAPIEPRLDESSSLLTPPPPHHHQRRTSSRNAHMRSFSDFSHPYPDGSFIPPSSSNNHHHRRAISTNSLDFILQHPRHDCSMTDYHPDEEDEQVLLASSDDGEDQHHPASMTTPTTTTLTTSSSSSSGSTKYHCPYCDKGFSRPSSLRIHTYSHTGEKPFVCTEPGCSRKFSVQSNMRRHLRVHAKRAVWPDQHHHRFSLASNQQQQHG